MSAATNHLTADASYSAYPYHTSEYNYHHHYNSNNYDDDENAGNDFYTKIPSSPPGPWKPIRNQASSVFGLVKNIDRQGEVVVGAGILAAAIIVLAIAFVVAGNSSSMSTSTATTGTTTTTRKFGGGDGGRAEADAAKVCLEAVEAGANGITWAEAEENCGKRFGGHLATADADHKFKAIEKVLGEIGTNGASWIGLRSRTFCSSRKTDCKDEDLYWSAGDGGDNLPSGVEAHFADGLHGAYVPGRVRAVLGLGEGVRLRSYVCQTYGECESGAKRVK